MLSLHIQDYENMIRGSSMTRAILRFFILCEILVIPTHAAAQTACTRADLQSSVDTYLAAQRSGTPASLPRAAYAKYIENTEASSFDKGILKSPLKIDFSRSPLDTEICETFTEVIVTDKGHPSRLFDGQPRCRTLICSVSRAASFDLFAA